MNQQLLWEQSHMVEPTAKDCEWAAWLFFVFGDQTPEGFWTTLRDLKIHG